MATTDLSLGEHWEMFIKNEVSGGVVLAPQVTWYEMPCAPWKNAKANWKPCATI
ncbi:hypothetical protein L3081_18705 [Colwellia sp. MSW7]|uniref:Uncharacterized protein n=1 Tax=Colwellia maritima TaxID=2912588 RepID=A0ABS9X492_9GAMM|nr:hypothetical protein [Colwellia maritima]MCI2285052.1 hypothetical protein [Colwellia maritima]